MNPRPRPLSRVERGNRKVRLDHYVVEHGWALNTKEAQAMILAGEFRVDSQPASSGTLVSDEARVERLPRRRFVSRGGEKLNGALDAFSLTPFKLVCLDIGASTGGFTDCLLQRGARAVWALDVGRGLLDPHLRKDARVHVLDGINFRHFGRSLIQDPIDLATVDVSFISLSLIFPNLWRVLAPQGCALVLVKPQFEAPPKSAPKGVVREQRVRRNILQSVKHMAEDVGFVVKGSVDSSLKGRKGNQESFLYLEKGT